MDPIRPLFFNSAFDLHYEGMSLNLRGLISLTGITRIFVSVGIPDSWVQALGKIVIVKVEGVEIEGALLQQMVEHGSFYEVKFVNLSDQVKTYLETRLQRESVHPGWQRKFPRISVNGYEDPDLPVPNLCMVRFVGQEIFVNVINFTLGGIRIETLGDEIGRAHV